MDSEKKNLTNSENRDIMETYTRSTAVVYRLLQLKAICT